MAFTFKPLWKTLIDLEMSKTELRRRIGILTSTLARMRQDKYIGLKILSDICGELGCTPNDIIEYVPGDKE